LVIININSSILSKDQTSKDIHLEAPHLGDQFRSNRPPIKSRTNMTKKKTQPKTIINKDEINPCAGIYTKTNGTTCGLKEIMLGRCYELQYIKRDFFLTNES
jgi:hypothetical protein